jgi:hypothetical protein
VLVLASVLVLDDDDEHEREGSRPVYARRVRPGIPVYELYNWYNPLAEVYKVYTSYTDRRTLPLTARPAAVR